jgi:hypothetical protein
MSENLPPQIQSHLRLRPTPGDWEIGVRSSQRIHPWDEQELPFPTQAWLTHHTSDSAEAEMIAAALFAFGCRISPAHLPSGTSRTVFIYALN